MQSTTILSKHTHFSTALKLQEILTAVFQRLIRLLIRTGRWQSDDSEISKPSVSVIAVNSDYKKGMFKEMTLKLLARFWNSETGINMEAKKRGTAPTLEATIRDLLPTGETTISQSVSSSDGISTSHSDSMSWGGKGTCHLHQNFI